MCPCSSTSWQSVIISSKVQKKISLQAIKYDRNGSGECEKDDS